MSLKKNVLANYLGQGWRAIMSLAFVPLYIKYLGIEAYGLIGIFVMLQAWLSLLDMGMRPTLVREMARFTGGGHDVQSIWDLLRSIELIAFGMAALIGLSVWGASGWLATDWVQAEQMSVEAMAQAFTLMGLVVALRFIENIYTNSIAGLQRQVLQNVVTSIMATFRGLGAVGVLVWVSPTIEAFFIWQGIISFVTAVIFMILVYRLLPRSTRRARFSLTALLEVWRFAAGMLGITLLALLLTQVDKILLSRLLSLENFGYYALASMVAGGLYLMVTPIGAAFYPRFTELLTRDDDHALRKTYHLGAQLVTVLMGSAAVILIVYADRILLLWTGDPALTKQVAPVMAVLVLGTFLNGLMWVPYQMQLAYGWTSLSVRINFIAVLFLIPAILWLVPIYGAMGAAWAWVGLNFFYVFIGVHFMYRKILVDEKWRWYIHDILLPLLAAVGGALVIHSLGFIPLSPFEQISQLILASLVTLMLAVIAAKHSREKLMAYMQYYFNR